MVEEACADKERLFGFAKRLNAAMQRNDAAWRIRENVVTATVGRRMGGRGVQRPASVYHGGAARQE